MQKYKNVVKTRLIIVLIFVIISGLSLADCRRVFAEDKSETVIGKVYQFGEKGDYDISSAESSASTDTGTELDGQFSISGNISSVMTKNGVPAYSVNGGLLTFSYVYDGDLLDASEDEDHLVNDNSKKVNGTTLASDIKKGALIVQTSKDGQIWYDVLGASRTDIFKDNPDGLKNLYTTTAVQLVNGCYYRILIAYKTGIRTQKAQKFPPKFEKYEYKKYVEAYSFYAYDETAIKVTVPESKNRRNLGTKIRTKREGYAGSASMDNDDPHFGWEIGQFFVGGYTDYENNEDSNPIFLKNNGDKLSLWFELKQDIDKCYNNASIRVIADTEGSDAEFEVPGGVNETTDFGRGALIIRKTNPDGTRENPQIYTNYLEASASTDAITKVDLLEEGDYEVALDYAIKFDKTKILGKSILPETAKYRIPFKFSVRNGNSMIFLFDRETGSELSSGSITENGFRLDFANSQYLRVNVKREVLKDGFDGLTEDTRFNSVATDGDEFTDEGVYTLTITNRDLENIDPTIKRVYVGTNNILKAYMVNNIPISEIKEMVALGATIADDGTIIPPEPEPDAGVETITEEPNDESELTVISEDVEEVTVSQTAEELETTSSVQAENQVVDEQSDSTAGKHSMKTDSLIIPISSAAGVLVAGLLFFNSRRKKR